MMTTMLAPMKLLQERRARAMQQDIALARCLEKVENVHVECACDYAAALYPDNFAEGVRQYLNRIGLRGGMAESVYRRALITHQD